MLIISSSAFFWFCFSDLAHGLLYYFSFRRGKPTPPIEDSTLVEHKMQSTKLNIWWKASIDYQCICKCHFFWQESWTDREIDSRHYCNEPESQVCGSEVSGFRLNDGNNNYGWEEDKWHWINCQNKQVWLNTIHDLHFCTWISPWNCYDFVVRSNHKEIQSLLPGLITCWGELNMHDDPYDLIGP